MYAGDRYNDNTLSFANLKFILLLQDFFQEILTVCAFCLCFFLVFFASLGIMKSRYKKKKKKKKKKIHKDSNNLQTEQTHDCAEAFSDYHVKTE